MQIGFFACGGPTILDNKLSFVEPGGLLASQPSLLSVSLVTYCKLHALCVDSCGSRLVHSDRCGEHTFVIPLLFLGSQFQALLWCVFIETHCALSKIVGLVGVS